jgi:hypothetical protein
MNNKFLVFAQEVGLFELDDLLVEGYRLAPVFFHDWMGSSLLYDVISIIE